MNLDIKQLIEELQSEDEADRRYAAEDLGELGAAEAIPHLVKALEDPSVGVREAATDALIAIGGEEVVRAVIPLLYSENPPLRNYATEILEHTGKDAPGEIMKLCESPSVDVRKFALDILGKIGEVQRLESLEPIIRCLQDEDVNVAGAAAEALGKIGDPEVIPILTRLLDDKLWLQCNAINAIAQIGGKRAEQALESVQVETLSNEARYFYQMAMEKLKSERREIV